jgi:hypothetical protein
MFNNLFSESSAVYDIMWKILWSRTATNDNIIGRILFTCSITKATNTHSEYAMLIVFPRQ